MEKLGGGSKGGAAKRKVVVQGADLTQAKKNRASCPLRAAKLTEG